jgi:hypothetical protein
MSRRLVGSLGLLAALWLATGCSTLIVAASTTVGQDRPSYPSYTARQVVERRLGPAVASRPLPDGGVVATYRYRVREPEPNAVGKFVAEAELDLVRADARLWLLLQPLLIPTATGAALYAVFDARHDTVTFGFGPHGELLYANAPPGYGPDDDALAAPSIGALRRSCWGEPEADPDAAERRYVECLTSRFAIWAMP